MERLVYQIVCLSPGWLVTLGGQPAGQIFARQADAIRTAKGQAAAAYPAKLIIRDEAGDIVEEILFDGPTHNS